MFISPKPVITIVVHTVAQRSTNTHTHTHTHKEDAPRFSNNPTFCVTFTFVFELSDTHTLCLNKTFFSVCVWPHTHIQDTHPHPPLNLMFFSIFDCTPLPVHTCTDKHTLCGLEKTFTSYLAMCTLTSHCARKKRQLHCVGVTSKKDRTFPLKVEAHVLPLKRCPRGTPCLCPPKTHRFVPCAILPAQMCFDSVEQEHNFPLPK